jgi:hypothetical protein
VKGFVVLSKCKRTKYSKQGIVKTMLISGFDVLADSNASGILA